ncbi:Hypothetical protein NTJ_14826 [Nesidiocoris tenuis]|uniref:C2H2-type domain-containing protein n=1 Tax=Nesidiocoris tenuis TaxID=355587 RepID=A0ABN7BGN3_9HEMI|nr:Hypothetical protein NTJ_14826 [Nesidiocoris tenuis]
MVYCYFAGCNSYPRPERLGCDESVKFFPFPQPCVRVKERDLDWDESLLNNHVQNCDECRLCWNWVLKCRRNDVKIDCVRSVNSNTQICSKHFDNISSKIDYEKCLPLSPVPQVKIEPEDEMAEAVKAESDGMNLEHDLVIIKTEKNDFDDNQEVEDVDDPILHGPANSGVLPGSEYNDVKMEPSSSELARIGNRQEQGTEDGDCDNELTSDFLPVSAEIGALEGYSDSEAESTRTGKRTFQCLDCDYNTGERKLLRQHISRQHSETHRITCSFCDYTTARKDNMKMHMTKHDDQIFQCALCDYRTEKKGCLTQHLKKHAAKGAYECPSCSYSSSQRKCLTQHIRRQHAPCQFPCTECNYVGVRKEQLTLHMKRHMDQMLQCSFCDYRTVTKSYLALHEKRHTGEGQFPCSECDYVAVKANHLERHKLKHTGEKTFRCPDCDSTFQRKDTLTRHMMKHLTGGQRLFKCTQCSYAVERKDCLLRHMKKHNVDELESEGSSVHSASSSCAADNAEADWHSELVKRYQPIPPQPDM